MNFENLGLAEELLKAVASTGYTTPTPVQQRAIPAAIAAAACWTCTSKLEPPVCVESVQRGAIPRYSASSNEGAHPGEMHEATPSTSAIVGTGMAPRLGSGRWWSRLPPPSRMNNSLTFSFVE